MIHLLAEPISIEQYLLFGVIALSVLIVIYYFVTRWIFSIRRQLWNQKQQINLLVKIARQLGVTDVEELSMIQEKNNSEDHLL